MRFEHRVVLTSVLTSVPALLCATVLLLLSDVGAVVRWTTMGVLVAVSLLGALALVRLTVRPLRSMATLLEGLRKEDYSLRGVQAAGGALQEAFAELNLLARRLSEQRFARLEADALLHKLVSELDIAIFALDEQMRLSLVNPAAEVLFSQKAQDLLGCTAGQLGLSRLINDSHPGIVEHSFPAQAGRWEVRTRRFRQGGRAHVLLVVSDLSHALREEERRAWKRIMRVIGHELNSSLTPIKSLSGTLRKLLLQAPLPEGWQGDISGGLSIIHDRADSLRRFMSGYARLARLPHPQRAPVPFEAVVRSAAALYPSSVAVLPGPEVMLEVDKDQIEQVLINLMKNAVEAVGGGAAGVTVRWSAERSTVSVEIVDDGPGLTRSDSLWVPFFTTKPDGSGIGLPLSREIVENHGGTISLENRTDAPGCVARVVLPLCRSRPDVAREA